MLLDHIILLNNETFNPSTCGHTQTNHYMPSVCKRSLSGSKYGTIEQLNIYCRQILLMICWTACICMDFLQVAANKFLFMNIGRENVISYHISTWQLNLGLLCCSYVRSGFQSPQLLQRVICRTRTRSDCNTKLYMSQQIVRTILQKMTCVAVCLIACVYYSS